MPPKVIMRSLRIDEIAGTPKPAMGGALVAFIKRAPVAELMKGCALTSSDDGHTHLIRLYGFDGKLSGGMTEYADGHSHPWVRGSDGPVIGEADGHKHTIATVGKSADGTPREEPMADPTKTPEELLKAEKAELEKKLARSNALASLSDAEKAYMKSLPEADGEKFLTLTPEARAALIKAAGEANPVVFKSADGTEFRKSDPPAMVAMAKKLDEQAATIARNEALTKHAAYEKRATEELPSLPGDLPTKTAMLKAIDGIADEALRAKALETLKSQNKEMAEALKNRGTSSGGTPGSAEDRLDAMAKARASKDGIPYAKAYDLVLQSPEGSAIYAEYAKSREK